MIKLAPNLVFPNTFLNAPIFPSKIFLSSTISTLFSTTINFFINNSAIIIHSAVCAWIPFVASTIKNIMSIICAPPIIVLIRDAWPGQSTSVNCRYCYFSYCYSRVGTLVKKAEKPRSRVMPLSWDCGFLSKLAVEVTSLNMRHSEVLPESTWPSTPTLMFRHLLGWMAVSYSFVISSRSFSMLLLLRMEKINIFYKNYPWENSVHFWKVLNRNLIIHILFSFLPYNSLVFNA